MTPRLAAIWHGPATGWLRRWPAAWRRHWLAATLLAGGLALRVLAQFAYRPALFYIDTTRYLYNAEGMDPVGYKGPLRAILLVANFDAVAAVQHLLGLAMAVVIYLLLLRRGTPRWLAALATAPVLLDAYQIQAEQSIMPGAWFEALIVGGLAILLWQPQLRLRRAVAAGVVLGTSATVAQVGEALIVPAVIYLLVAETGWRQAARKAAALCAAFALPILAYCTGSYLSTGDFSLSHTGVTSFYGRTAAAVDCATIRLTPPERGMCPAKAQQAKGPDWLEYGPGSPIRPYYADLPRAEADRLLADFNRRVLTQQPLRLAAAYGRDVVKVFALTRTTSPGDTPVSRWQFQPTFPYYPPHASAQVVRTAAGRFGGGMPAVWRPAADFLRSYQLGGGYTPGPLLALCALAGAAGLAGLRRRKAGPGSQAADAGEAGPGSRDAGPGSQAADAGEAGPGSRDAGPGSHQLALACLLFFAAAVFVTLVSDLFEFSWRYQLPALVTLAPAGALGIGAVARSIKAARISRAGSGQTGGGREAGGEGAVPDRSAAPGDRLGQRRGRPVDTISA